MSKYYYKAEGWTGKLIIPFFLIFAGILMVFYIPVESEFTALLISLIYIAGFILILFDTIPFIFRVLKSRGQGISINKNSIIFLNKRDSNRVLEENKIDREDILQVEFKSHSNGKLVISPEEDINEIEERIHKMTGRSLIISSKKSEKRFKSVIYLELLEKEFLFNFINWYQVKEAGDDN